MAKNLKVPAAAKAVAAAGASGRAATAAVASRLPVVHSVPEIERQLGMLWARVEAARAETERTKEALQELATRLARAFQATAGADRRVKVVIRPYDVERSGWVSL